MAFNAKKYNREFLLAAAAYAAVLVASRLIATRFDVGGAMLMLLALAPIIPAIGATHVYLRHFRMMDELQRRIQIEAFAAGALFVGLASFAIGFIEDLAPLRLSLIWVLPSMLAAWGLIACVLRYRYLR